MPPIASIFFGDNNRAIKLWDIAAGILIAEAAGAVVTDNRGKKIFPVDIAAYNGARFEIVAANKKVHAELIKMLQS